MKRPPPPLQYVVVAATRVTAMTSRPSFGGGRSQRGYSSRPYSGGGRGHYVTGDSHIRSVRDANLGLRQRENTGTFTDQTDHHLHHHHNSNQHRRPPPSDHNQPYRPNHLFRPPQQYGIRPRPQKPLDYRNWEYAKTTLPPNSEKFMVLSYNILADYLANDHRGKLYYHIPRHMMDWQWRKKNLLFELRLWSADILCFQEVDRFGELEEELRVRGYNGIWKMRTGNPVDGCAVFWRTSRFKLLHEECIEFSRLGLRDNVAQICVLESLHQTPKESNAAFSTSPRGSNKVVICNIHVLYNPRRGEIKLGQLRVLLDKARAASKLWNDAPIVLCGDFNCTPKSPLYNFISEQKLELSEVDRDKVSGQASAEICPPGSYNHNYRGQHGSVQGLPMLQGKEVETKPDISDSLNQKSQKKGEEDTQLLSQPQVSNTGDIFGDSCSDVHSEKDDACHAEANKETKHTSVDVSKVESESALHVQGDGFKEDPSTSIGDGYMLVECTSDPTDSYACVEKESMSCSILNIPSTKENLTTGVGCDPGFVNRFDSKVSPSEVSGQTSFADAIEGSPLGTLGHFPSESSFVVDKDISCASNSVDLEEQKRLENLSLVEHDEAIPEAGKTTEDDGTFLSALHTGDGSTSDFASDPPKYMLSASNDRTEDGLSPEMDSDLVGVGKFTYDPALWTPMEIETATGNGECTLLEHPLKLRSTYTEVEDCSGTRDSNGEPLVTSYNRCFFGTVDYIWRSEGLQTVRVLAPIPKHAMQWTSGFPTRKWGSDHIALVSELVFTNCCDES